VYENWTQKKFEKTLDRETGRDYLTGSLAIPPSETGPG
jgi:hypothetical protein